MRVDIWDVKKAKEDLQAFDQGYPRDFPDLFELGQVIGKGGFGHVRVITEKATGDEYACKSIRKILQIPNLPPAKQAQHIDNIRREIKVLSLLKGTLSVVYLRGVWEDEEEIHIVMEYCRGGELHHGLGRHPYTEAMVSTYMASVLQTIAQCHSRRILHRDIKPGNFMLLTKEKNSPLKAIDFGLAAFYSPDDLPRTDLGLDGTPWFMAPEVLNSETYPVSDVWSAGVMCYQLLCGYLPFDDRNNPSSPSLSLVWRSILTDEPSFSGSSWKNVTKEAVDFVKLLLEKDHAKRPSAKKALGHPWLQPNFHKNKMRPLDATVLQRIQRFGQVNLLKRSILELIAAELIKVNPPRLPDPTVRGGIAEQMKEGDHASSSGGSGSVLPGESPESSGMLFPLSPEKDKPMQSFRSRSKSMDSLRMINNATNEGSAHRVDPLRQKLFSVARRGKAFTTHGGREYWRALRQASSLAAQGSGHGRNEYLFAATASEQERGEHRKAARLSLDTSTHGGEEYKKILQRIEGEWTPEPMEITENKIGVKPEQSEFFKQHESTPSAHHGKRKHENSLEEGGRGRSAALEALNAARIDSRIGDVSMNVRDSEDTRPPVESISSGVTDPKELESIMKELHFRNGKALSKEALAEGLHQLGYEIEPTEVSILMDQLDLNSNSTIEPSAFVASQLDWSDLQRNNKELWLQCAQKAFQDLDQGLRGHITTEGLVASLRKKLPDEEINHAVEDALVEAGIIDSEQLDFEAFLRMVQMGSLESHDNLDLYDSRMAPSSAEGHLDPVPEG